MREREREGRRRGEGGRGRGVEEDEMSGMAEQHEDGRTDGRMDGWIVTIRDNG